MSNLSSINTQIPLYHLSSSGVQNPLRQGEILSHVIQSQLDLATLNSNSPRLNLETHVYVLILTQACDLEQDHRVRFTQPQPKSNKLLPSILMCHVFTALELRGNSKDSVDRMSSEMWKRISQNKDERYHFLQKIDSSCDVMNDGLPELCLDFKKYFTLPTGELYKRIELNEAKRRCVLASPYMEHLCDRFSYFLSRIALPADHLSD
jgi:hypothetical protein